MKYQKFKYTFLFFLITCIFICNIQIASANMRAKMHNTVEKFNNIKTKICNKLPKKKQTERKSLKERQENYIEIKENLKLNDRTLDAFYIINEKEYKALRPIALELETMYLRQNELDNTECKFYQRTCKKELKKDKKFLENDIKELKRKIWQKKEYYKILYLNNTSRKQDLKLRQIIKNTTKNKPQLW